VNDFDYRRAVAQPCVNGEWQNSTPRGSETPQPINIKIETGDYVHETTPCAKFCANPSIGGFSANRWTITKIFLAYTGWRKKTSRTYACIIHRLVEMIPCKSIYAMTKHLQICVEIFA